MPDEGESVKVAVRVRPFNKRERARNAELIISMNGSSTSITNPEDKSDTKSFTFDHSYWSFDGCKEENDGYFSPDSSIPNGSKFAGQKQVFDDLGKGVLRNCWDGYNTSLFAYGQTGSGKSWSVIGYGVNKGIVPMFCEGLFNEIKAKQDAGDKADFEVKFSMLEIYNEVVRDLLTTKQAKRGLKIRQHPKKGFYAEGLNTVSVASYDDINRRMEEGTLNRTVAATNMNATSSRAHTIVGINFIQKSKNATGQETAKSAIVNLVDLAGSERVESTGATGDRLKEGAAINQSLSALGNVIHALADQSQGKNVKVPFRDSALTKLLQNALGGNSKTIMIAAISPADINFDESLSTLRYADRAKQIKTHATVNEDPTEKLLRELKEENEALRKAMAAGEMPGDKVDQNISPEDVEELKKKWMEEMKANMAENEKDLKEMKTTKEERLKQAQSNNNDAAYSKTETDKKTKCHIYNLNFDPQLSGKIINILKAGSQEVGNKKGKESDITVVGPGINTSHALINNNVKANTVSIKPSNTDCRVLVNGSQIQGDTTLCHNDRLQFGSTQIWVFQNPKEAESSGRKFPDITYEYAQEEIAAKAGIEVNTTDSGGAKAVMQEELIQLMPYVEEANSISEELDKRVKFEIMLVSPRILGKEGGKTQICVRLKNLENGTEFVWPKDKFLNRLYLMKEMYHNYEEEEQWDVPEDKDPFVESMDTEVLIGTATFILTPLAYSMELQEQLEVTNLKGLEVAKMNVEIVPCDKNGRDYTEVDDQFVEDPLQLVGKDYQLNVRILNCRGLPTRYRDVYCSFKFYLDEKDNNTIKVVEPQNPNFNFNKMYAYSPVTNQLVTYLQEGSITVQVKGKQRIRRSAMPNKHLTTKDMLKSDRAVFSRGGPFEMNGRIVDPQKQSIIVELLLMKKTQARLQQRVDSMKKLVDAAESLNRKRVSTHIVRAVLMAPSKDSADEAIKMLEDDYDDPNERRSGGVVGSGSGSGSSVSTSSGACCFL